MIELPLAALVAGALLAAVRVVRHRQRLRAWRPSPPRSTTTHPSRVWEFQAREAGRGS